MTDNEKQHEELVKQVLQSLADSFSVIEGVTAESELKLTYSAAISLTHFIERILEKEKVHFSLDLAKILICLCHFIVDHEESYLFETKKVYEILTR